MPFVAIIERDWGNDDSNVWPKVEPEITNATTINTNIYIYLDTTWPFNMIVDYLGFVVQRLNINPYASSVMLFNAADASPIVNRTHYLSEFFTQWNITTHSFGPQGFSLPQILNSVRDEYEFLMSKYVQTATLSGQSFIALMMPSPVAVIGEYDYRYCMRFMRGLNATLPDVHYLYYAGGAIVRYRDFVADPHEDLYPLAFEMDVWQSAQPLVDRIRKVPRRLINPRCDAHWSSLSWGSNQMPQYVHLGGINFYRLLPNYFWGWGSMRFLRIKAITAISFTICTSRTLRYPFRNSSSPYTTGQECTQIMSNDFTYDLTDICLDGSYTLVSECPPLYMSVQAQNFADSAQNSCQAPGCQAPNEAQYEIFANNLGCNSDSGVTRTLAWSHFATLAIFANLFLKILII